ncbi:MAG: hypothetical protein JXR95_02680 [Deltaproteobacteria bacterium]|nr:hypothetical protein [Deltaproteobacteria bacterium]
MHLLKLFFIISVFSVFSGCSGSSGKTTMPSHKNPPVRMMEILKTVVTSGTMTPGMERDCKSVVNSEKTALNAVSKLFPEESGKLECWTKIQDYYVFSVKTKDDKMPPCSYVQILYIRSGTSKVYNYWP